MHPEETAQRSSLIRVALLAENLLKMLLKFDAYDICTEQRLRPACISMCLITAFAICINHVWIMMALHQFTE